MQAKELLDESLHVACIDALLNASLDLSLCLVYPLRDIFCTSRRYPMSDFRYLECTEMCVTEAFRLVSTVFSGILSTHKLKPNTGGRQYAPRRRKDEDGNGTY
jgi:hypothetical protein